MNKMCGNCAGDHKYEDCPIIDTTILPTKKEYDKLKEDAEAYNRLLPWILHVMDCYECHKKGTDVCDYTRNRLKEDKTNDVEIVVLPDNIEDARKALEDMK